MCILTVIETIPEPWRLTREEYRQKLLPLYEAEVAELELQHPPLYNKDGSPNSEYDFHQSDITIGKKVLEYLQEPDYEMSKRLDVWCYFGGENNPLLIHSTDIYLALYEGLPVPENVLADYPEIKEEYKKNKKEHEK
jgi:hypothetical protein